jgi:hypothetical protein
LESRLGGPRGFLDGGHDPGAQWREQGPDLLAAVYASIVRFGTGDLVKRRAHSDVWVERDQSRQSLSVICNLRWRVHSHRDPTAGSQIYRLFLKGLPDYATSHSIRLLVYHVSTRPNTPAASEQGTKDIREMFKRFLTLLQGTARAERQALRHYRR